MIRRFLHLSASAANKNLINKPKMQAGKSLCSVVSALEEFAPINLAENWDNVGLLIEPYKQRTIRKILLTNDLTEAVMEEVLEKNADMIISYHPPIFAPLKCITQANWKSRIISMCLNESIPLYSPHTTWDAVPNGINDWLLSAFQCKDIQPVQPNPNAPPGTGSGRLGSTNISLAEAIEAVQKHIGLDVHVAIGKKHNLSTIIKRVAVCAGSGGMVLKNVPADLYLTGEMSHHDLLDAQHRNISVILCNHSNSERGFLKIFQSRLTKMLDDACEVIVAENDKDPLKTFVKQF